MTTDGVFYLKVPSYGASLPWPNPTKHIVLEPPRGDSVNGDWRTSTAYGVLASQLLAAGGNSAVSALRRQHQIDGEVAFVTYSAGFGFLDKIFKASAIDLETTSAALLLDSSFGTGIKEGYRQFGRRAAAGNSLLVASTANTGGDDSWAPTWQAFSGSDSRQVEPRGTMPAPSGGVFQTGKLAFWYRFVDAQGKSELPHWEQHKLCVPMMESYLIPYWSGALKPKRSVAKVALLVGAAAAGGALAAKWFG